MRVLFRMGGKNPSGVGVILYYHSIPDAQRSRFARQMELLQRIATPSRLDDLLKVSSGEHRVLITFDDGFRSILRNAVPEMLRRRIPAIIFVPTAKLGGRPDWLEKGSAEDDGEPIMSPEDVRNLVSNGLIDMGSHCATHRSLKVLRAEEARHEIYVSKKDLEQITGKPAECLSYPHGEYDQGHVEIAERAGYRYQFNILPASLYGRKRDRVIGRVLADPSDWEWEFRLKIKGAYRWLPKAFSAMRFIRNGLSRALCLP